MIKINFFIIYYYSSNSRLGPHIFFMLIRIFGIVHNYDFQFQKIPNLLKFVPAHVHA